MYLQLFHMTSMQVLCISDGSGLRLSAEAMGN